jgi:hypothetical protein
MIRFIIKRTVFDFNLNIVREEYITRNSRDFLRMEHMLTNGTEDYDSKLGRYDFVGIEITKDE